LFQTQLIDSERLHAELWISLASLLRCYTAAHGMHKNRHATVEVSDAGISVRHEEKWLHLDRIGAIVTWTRENVISGRLEMTHQGTLRDDSREDELDLAAEAWARELMR
jgi:hypothetical protein